MCASTVGVRNTFICVTEDDEVAPAERSRRRARTAGDALTAVAASPSATAAGLAGDTCARANEEEGPTEPPAAEDERYAEVEAALAAGGWRRVQAVAAIASTVRELSFDPSGCHLVQRAFDFATPVEAMALCAGLRDCVGSAARSPHAHQVLLKIVHRVSTEDAAFIAQGLAGLGRPVALNVYSCAVVCRLLEHSAASPLIVALTDELLCTDLATLCSHKFGHRLASSVLSNGLPRQRAQVVSTLRTSLQRFARHRFASQVLQQALLCSSAEDSHLLASELLGPPSAVASLACHSFGVHVVRVLLQLPTVCDRVLHALQKGSRRVMKDKYGRQLMQELGLGEDDFSASTVAAACIAGA